MITDGHGTPLEVLLTGGNRNDVTQLLPLLDAIPPVRGRVGRPRRKPDSLFADRGYDHGIYRDQVRARGIVPAIARRGTRNGTGLGTYRWVVERSFAWLHGFRRLRIRWTLAMLALAFLTALAADAAPQRPADAHHLARSRDPITLTVPEIRHLFAAIFNPPAVTAAGLLHWSNWRRRHQATARRSHYRRRTANEPAG